MPPDNAFDFGHDWVLPYRYERIREWLGGPGQRTLEDSLELQNDEFSSVMASLLPKMLEQVSDPELHASEPSPCSRAGTTRPPPTWPRH